MDPKPMNARDIFSEMLEIEDPHERVQFLDQACKGNAALRAELESLLFAHDQSEGFLPSPDLDQPVTLDSAPLAEGPGSIIGRYKLLEKIGEGGMAVVYMAEQEQPIHRKVALKLIKLGMDTKNVIARFEAERQALAMMDHPNIAKVFDAGATDTGRPYFVMELVHGVSMTEFCNQQNLPMPARLGLFSEICNAMQHAHQRGIIHRDLKPSNVMVTMHDDKAVPKVIDFGIAKATNQRLTEKTVFTRYAQMIGTPAYMSPEQAQMSGLDIDTRSDIYSLGVLLYELLTDSVPFGDEELRHAGYLEMQRIISEEEPVKPSTKLSTLGDTLTEIAKQRCCTPELLRKTIRGDLDWIVMISLEKNRTRRYETASAFKRDIERYLQHEPVHARRSGAVYRLKKYLYRHRVHAIVALVAVVLTAAMIALTTMANTQRERQAEIERIERAQQVEAERVKEGGILSQARKSLASRDRQAALKAIKEILDSQHVGPEARLLHAGILVDGGDYELAKGTLEDLLNEKSDIAGAAHSLLAQLLLRRLSPNDEKGLRIIEQHQQRAQELLPDSAEACFLRALTALSIKEKRFWLQEALDLDPQHYESWRLRALINKASRRYEALKEDAQVLTVLDKHSDSLGYTLRATAFTELGKYKQALAAYDKAIEHLSLQDIEYAELSTQRNDVRLRMGEYDRVIADARDCLQRIPPDLGPVRFSAQLQFQVFFGLTVLGQYKEAGTLFTQVINGASNSLRECLMRDYFEQWSSSYVFDALTAGRPWHATDSVPEGSAFRIMREAEERYFALTDKGAHRLFEGSYPQWSPDGTQLAFNLGVHGNSGIAIYNPKTGATDLITVPGRKPCWSPDGRHIAFWRDSQMLQMERLLSAESERRANLTSVRDKGRGEIWVMKADGTEARRLGIGMELCWQDAEYLTYWDKPALYAISIEDKGAQPQTILERASWRLMLPVPDGSCDAFMGHKSIKIVNRKSNETRHHWQDLPGLYNGNWAPSYRQFCAGVSKAYWNQAGLWFFDLDSGQATQIFDGQVISAAWAPDEMKLAITLGHPFNEIWLAEIDPNVSVIESLGPGRTLEAYYRDRVHYYTRRIEMDPGDADCYLHRAVCFDNLHDKYSYVADMERYADAIRPPVTSHPREPEFRDFLKRLWQGTPRNLGALVNSTDTENFVTVSSHGRELYFSSRRPGGQGDYDLWGGQTVFDPGGMGRARKPRIRGKLA